MRLAHLADLHLGLRQYARLNQHGINQREADVGEAFRRAVDDVIEQRADLVVFAGDVFHSVRPTNSAILFAFRQLQRIRHALPATPVVIVAGEHDTPRSVETGSILRLFEALDVHVVNEKQRRLEFPALETSVLAIPHAAWSSRPVPRPSGSAPIQILVTHGLHSVIDAHPANVEYGGALLTPADLSPAAWTYVALGHYHVMQEIEPNAWYSGSLEFTNSHPWMDLRRAEERRVRGKGYLLVDLPEGAPQFRAVGPVREHIDLPPVQGAGLGADALNAEISQRIESCTPGIDDCVVRLVLWDVPRHVARELNHTAIRDYKARALHFNLDVRPPAPDQTRAVSGAPRRHTLPDVVKDYLSRRPLPDDIKRELFVETGMQYLAQAMRGRDSE